ncbi:heme ABC transporter permease CcmC [Hyphococcus flavus]|uniref:Heme exporter protein C n=1 Tax=Hyphococcus flavus TaxID=1866326 RepID=A0AAF0CBF9_9PROT|nr:heme ABC transporter permease CcmC [Hyphococcus flavus]WDI30865.1 heme ABC transporter permease CcmC [Hyphococcus flavus]
MWSRFSNPAKFEEFARVAGPIAFWIFALCAAFGVIVGLFIAPAEQYQGESARIMYVHVPAAWMAMASYSFIAFMSLVAFVWRHSLADVAARSAAAPGAVFTALALFTGAVWGKPTWGAFWVWDARLTSMLLLLFIYFGYMAVWQAVPERARAARFARILALVGFINIPIIKFSVDWWNSLHQPASIIRADGPTIDPSMLWPLFAMIIAYTALFTWLVFLGMRAELAVLRMEKRGSRAPSRPVGSVTES